MRTEQEISKLVCIEVEMKKKRSNFLISIAKEKKKKKKSPTFRASKAGTLVRAVRDVD